jgi:hypothetical protein
MKWTCNSFRGILLETDCGNVAVNGGGTLDELEQAYIIDGKVPVAMILTCEHYHRSHNVNHFCRKHNVLLITTSRCAQHLDPDGVRTGLLESFGKRLFLKLGLGISFIPVRYDSVDPFCFMVHDAIDILGVVPDGRLFPDTLKYLFDCDTIILGNELHVPESAPAAMKRRLKSVCNSRAEISEMFKDFDGKVVCL